MAILLVVLYFFSSPSHGLDITNIFQNEKGSIFIYEEGAKTEDQSLSKVQALVHDPESRISIDIVSPDFLIPLIHWWFKVYAYFDDQIILIHDSAEPLMIYDIIDFSNLGTSGLNKISRELIKKDLIVNMVKELENNIKKNKLNLLKLSKLQIKNRFKTSSMRAKSISLIRSQIGQKAFFGQGMGNFEIYAPYINYMLDLHSLPKEMVSIAFVESSFNNEAHSKAQAKGVWQVMPQISERLLGECFGCDYRDDTLLSTWMASYLLRENLMILKDLPLAVTAYNSGIGPILTTKSQTKKKIKKFDIQSYFTHVKDKSIGFASRNYYSEFVAATIALAYRDELYQIPFSQISSKNFRIAISQCDFKYNPGQFWDNTAAPVNQHLSPGRTYKKGTFIITDKVKLPKFIILDSLPAFGKRPITVVEKLLKKNYRCSTK